ncbi:MAG: glycosyltransferase family 2 protein [Prevotella sp.]|nr:glycosyltransferase family 2 protein [Prevotella sp.]
MKLTVVIVSYNVRDFLQQCLESVFKALQNGVDGEIYVVDNRSSDDSVEMVRTRFPEVHLIANKENVGFSCANNQAIRLSHSDYVLLLNPDTLIEEDTLSKAVAFMDEHPQAGGAGVQMHNADGTLAPESRRAVPTPWVAGLKMLGKDARYYMSHLPWDQPSRIEVISGAFCLLRRTALDKVGLLDEEFFMYGEDIDLSYRLLKGGYENWYLPLPIVHFKGQSTQKSSFRYVHVFYQAMLIFFRKHYGHQSILFTLPIKVAIYFRAMLALVEAQVSRLKHFLNPGKNRSARNR